MNVLFFRADDMGVLDAPAKRLLDLFAKRHVPLSLAVIPQEVTDEFAAYVVLQPENLIDVHQHGYAHTSHNESGTFYGEFGANRTREQKRRELVDGFARIEKLFGSYAVKIFTPPWNRMDGETYSLLRALHYRGFSQLMPRGLLNRIARLRKNPFLLTHHLPDLSVSIDAVKDWRTKTPKSAKELWSEYHALVSWRSRIGVMLHANAMNDSAFDELDRFLGMLAAAEVPVVRMGALV